jgi:hypothetical protein
VEESQRHTEIEVGEPVYSVRLTGDYGRFKAKTPPFRAGILPTTPPYSTVDSRVGYSPVLKPNFYDR